ncbi:hypothetical protein PMAYCL1PPCAC_14786, partial [Pristionchus mayeri]
MGTSSPRTAESPFPFQTKFPSKLERFGYKCYFARLGVVSLATVYVPVLAIRCVTRHFLLTYKQWLFENPKKPSTTTKIWGALHYLLSLVSPSLKSCDALLPRQHIPALEQTVERYLSSIRPLHSKLELADIEAMAGEFLAREGRKLQTMTRLYGLFVDNYVTGFWESLATQAFRAARLAFVETQQQLAMDRQTFKPLGAGMICSSHLEKLYATTREPGEKIDFLRRYGLSRYILVLYNGGIYKVHVVDEKDRVYSVEELTDIFIELLARADSTIEGTEGRIAALTTDNRTQWYHNRRRFFEEIPKNAKALNVIESAIFAITLDSNDYGYDSERPELLSHFMRSMLTGNGANRWADKSLNHTVSRNGAFGSTSEHSVADGCELDAVHETFSFIENHVIGYPPLSEQQKREESFDFTDKRGLRFAERIEIEVPDEMAAEIERCYSTHLSVINNLHVASLAFRRWGKDRIKKCGCSPDAFMQMAIQLANYRDQGRFVLTYESASTRFYRNTRTETLRTVGEESCEFVRAMHDEAVDRTKRAEILRRACEAHVSRNRECMVGRGVDRHLFVLYVMAQATGTPSPFLDHCMQQEWLLSTS